MSAANLAESMGESSQSPTSGCSQRVLAAWSRRVKEPRC